MRIFSLCAVLAIGSTFVFPGEAAAQEDAVQGMAATAALPFLNMNPGPRANAMGGISTVGGTEPYSHFSNVAAVPFGREKFAAGVSYNMWQPSASKTNVVSAGAVYNINNRFGVTFGLLTNIGNSYEVMNETGLAYSTFTPMDLRVGAGFSYRIIDGLSVGVGLNYAQSSIAPKSDLYSSTQSTFAADVQVIYRFLGKISVSLSGNNLGVPVKSASGVAFQLPMNALVGVGYEDTFSEKHRISAGINFGSYFGAATDLTASAGLEYMFNDMIAVRGGFHYGDGKVGLPTYGSLGLGLKFFGVRLDVAYILASGPMKNTLSFGLGYSF